MKSLLNAAFGKLTLGTLFVLTIATAANAQQATGTGTIPVKDSATIQYLGMQDDMLIFNVSYDNPQGSKFVISLKDQDGTQLYQNSFRDKSFYKQFKLPKTDRDKVVFMIRSGQNTPIEKAFLVNVSSRFVQEVAIRKM
jgi:hypothetical protein